jgi:hypothetical protein
LSKPAAEEKSTYWNGNGQGRSVKSANKIDNTQASKCSVESPSRTGSFGEGRKRPIEVLDFFCGKRDFSLLGNIVSSI